MSILEQLSSKRGERSGEANLHVALQCIQHPDLLEEIDGGLQGKDAALAGDCAEVMTMVAEHHPEKVKQYADHLVAACTHKTTRVRWEAMHALSYIAKLIPDRMETYLPAVMEIYSKDASIIVRDYAVDVIGNYAASGEDAARQAMPLLLESTGHWDGRHAGHALNGLMNVVEKAPDLRHDILPVAEKYLAAEKAVIRKAAKSLHKLIQKS